MPNIVAELMQEIARVEALLTLDEAQQLFKSNAIRSAKYNMAMNSYEGMRESLDDLREIGRPKKKTDPQT